MLPSGAKAPGVGVARYGTAEAVPLRNQRKPLVGATLSGPVTVPISIGKALKLSLVIPQLIEETIAQIAASDARGVELPDNLNRLVQVLRIKTGLIRQPCAVVRCRGFGRSRCFLWRCRLRCMLRSGFSGGTS